MTSANKQKEKQIQNDKSQEKLSEEVSINLGQIKKQINDYDNVSNTKSNIPIKSKVSFVDISGTNFVKTKY
jgi:hypothetical protein